jgi:sulfate transporter 4
MERSSFASASSGELAAAAVSGLGRPVRVIPLRHPLDARGPASSSAAAGPSLLSAAMERARGMGPWEWAETALPCLAWMRSYRWKEDLQADLAAGITVGVMLVPQVRSDLILL